MPTILLMGSGDHRSPSAVDISQRLYTPMAGAWRTRWEYATDGRQPAARHDATIPVCGAATCDDLGAPCVERAGAVRNSTELIPNCPETLGWCGHCLRSLPMSDLRTSRTMPYVVSLLVGSAIICRCHDGRARCIRALGYL